MASAFGHAVAAIALGYTLPKQLRSWKFWLLAVACAIVPDADVISFALGIPYEAFWGHRGFTHSLLFAALLGISVTLIFYRYHFLSWTGMAYILFFTVCTASHSVLDAMTTGGLGVAFLSPWDDTRYFFPWTPIQVSPLGAANFFTSRGVAVLLSEFLWIFLPSATYVILLRLIRWRNKKA